MEELPRSKASRRGYRAHITKIYSRIAEITDSTEPITREKRISLTTALEQLREKQTQLKELDAIIINGINEEGELEQEVCNTEEYHTTLAEKIAYVRDFLDRSHATIPAATDGSTLPILSSTPSPSSSATVTITDRASETDTSRTATLPDAEPHRDDTSLTPARVTVPSTKVPPANSTTVSSVRHTHRTNEGFGNSTRLPKLNLPEFSGDPLAWQTFWDSFEAAIHPNPNLTGVQKFNYLRAQLQGDAARVVAGFPLTNSNYEHSIFLLRQRFGQPYKLINAHMQALLNLPKPANNHPSIQTFYDTIENHVRRLSSLGKSSESYGSLLTPIILNKLPNEIKKNLAREKNNSEWSLDTLMSNILKELKVIEISLHNGGNYSPSMPIETSFTTATFHAGTCGQANCPTGQADRKRTCVFCKGPHSPNACNTVTKPEECMSLVKENRLCFNCLAHHKVSQCSSKFRCRRCGRKHHTSLCTATPPRGAQNNSKNEPTNDDSKTVLTSFTPSKDTPQSSRSCLLKTAIAPISYEGTSIEGNILFDEGSQRSFISKDLACKLNLQPQAKENVSLTSFGAEVPSYRNLDIATISIQTASGEKIPISVLIVPTIALPLQNPIRSPIKEFPYLRGLPLAYPVTENENFEISVLIGADYYWHFVQDHVVRGKGPTAVQSKLGYLLSGPLPSRTQTALINLFHVATTTNDEVCNLENFWQVESSGVTTPAKRDADQQFLKTYIDSCVISQPDGSYSLKFPWKSNYPLLPSNYTTCERRTRALARRLGNDSNLLETYGSILSDHLKRGFIEKVTTSQHNKAHYIPHHPVKKQSSTTPIRIVFDCSCRSSQSHPSLNDCLLTGPPFLNDMCSILIRFRVHKYGFSTDIEKAFLHVNLHENDRDFTRFLWLSDNNDPESKFQIYRFKVVLFGSVSSPFMLHAALHHHLTKNPSAVSDDMQNNLYVDNVISGCNSEKDAVHYYKQSRTIMSQANFNLRTWASNSPQLQKIANQDGSAETSDTIKILGLQWNTSSDSLSLIPRNITNDTPFITKRDVLRDSSCIFDPLGFITPVTIQAKNFFTGLMGKTLTMG